MKAYKIYNWPLTIIIEKIYDLRKKKAFRRKNKIILIAAYPRSACNYLTFLLANLLNFKSKNFKITHGFYHDVVYLPKVIDTMSTKSIVTQHLRLTSLTRSIIVDLNLRPTVLVRNIFDVVISYNDYISKWGFGPLDPDKNDLAPEFCNEYFNFNEEKRFDYLIDTVIPWYISFFVSWYHYTIIKKEIQAFWLTYEDFISNTNETLNRLFDFYDVSISNTLVNTILSQNKKINFNRGIRGRGDILKISQKERIKNFTSYYPNVDFRMIGI